MSLADEIRKRLGSSQAAAPAASQQDAAIAAFQAKTGKASGGGAPRASNLGEQSAQGQVDATQRQLQTQGALAAEALGAQQTAATDAARVAQRGLEAQRNTARADLAAAGATAGADRAASGAAFDARLGAQEAAARRDVAAQYDKVTRQLASDRGITVDELFSEFRQGSQELAWRKDAAQLEQRASQLALADRAYVDNLVRVGEEQRLNNDLQFQAASQELALGEKLRAALEQQQWQVNFNVGDREFAEEMGNMDLATALAIAASQNADASMAQTLQNIGNAAPGIANNWPGGGSDGPNGGYKGTEAPAGSTSHRQTKDPTY